MMTSTCTLSEKTDICDTSSPGLRSDGKKIRLWMDGSFDMFHCGHASALQQARALGDSLTVGLQPDADVFKHKGPPVFPEHERMRIMKAVKWVDEFIGTAPWGTKVETLDKYNCDFCVHGDDLPVVTNPHDVLYALETVNRLKILALREAQEAGNVSGLEHSQDPLGDCTYISAIDFHQFSSGRERKPEDRVVYVDGAFDLFNVGHLDFLERAASEGDYLVVGVHQDQVVRWNKGPGHPILGMLDRALTLLSFRCVSDVILCAPYTITKRLMEKYDVKLVCHGKTPIKTNDDGSDPYAVPKQEGKLKVIDSNNDVRTGTIIERITNRREEYEIRNKKKYEKERKAQEEWAKKTGPQS